MMRKHLGVAALLMMALSPLDAMAEYVIDISAPAVVPKDEERLWFAYSVKLGMCIAENNFSYENYPQQCEIAGLDKMLQLLDQGEPLPSSAYFKQLQAVRKAGYLHEYVWRFQTKKYWTEPKGLKLAPFDSWARERLANHRAQRHLRATVAQR